MIIKNFDQLSGVTQLSTHSWNIFHQKGALGGFFGRSFKVDVEVAVKIGDGQINSSIVFSEMSSRFTPPQTGTLFLLIDGSRFKTPLDFERIVDQGDVALDIESGWFDGEIMAALADAQEAVIRIRGIEIALPMEFLDEINEILEEIFNFK